MKMTEIRFRCKDCKKEVAISTRVFKLMLEKGESLPERCEECRKKHKKAIKEIKIPYFQAQPEDESKFTDFDYILSAYTPHGERNRRLEEAKPDPEIRKRIKITNEQVRKFLEALRENQVVILMSPTGTGKSTYVLYRLIDALEGYENFIETLKRQGQIIQTQPLTEATERIPSTVGQKFLGEGSKPHEFGAVGLRHRGAEKWSKHNIAVVVTDGSLRNWIRDGRVDQYSLVIVDEAHKRTLNIESILLLLKHMLPLYPHLKVVVSSATIDPRPFVEAFKREGISVKVFDLSEELKEERKYTVHFWKGKPVEGCDCWLCEKMKKEGTFYLYEDEAPGSGVEELSRATANFVLELLKYLKEGEGVLVFLPGQAWITRTKELIDEGKKYLNLQRDIEVITVFRKMGGKQVAEAFERKKGEGRVLLATDIAETSHTFEDVVYVVDSGYIRELQWDPETLSTYLPVKRHSKAGCLQRWGRVGRLRRGYVYCLYTEEEFSNPEIFREQTRPEVFRNRLDDVVLTLRTAGVSEISKDMFIGSQEEIEEIDQELRRSLSSLRSEGLLDERGNVTEKTLELFAFPEFSPEEKALLDLADELNCLLEMLAAILMMRDDEGNPRTGAGLYNQDKHNPSGILLWDSNWPAKKKMEAWKRHQALKVGCRDDLDFVIKVAYCFIKAKSVGMDKEWVDWHHVDREVLESIFGEGGKFQSLLNRFRKRVPEERKIRELDPRLLERVRSAFWTVLSKKVFEVGENFTYLIREEKKEGVISRHCVGSWKKGESGVLVMATKEKMNINGQLKLVPSASFLVKPPELGEDESRFLFFDQVFPVGTLISIKQSLPIEGIYYVKKVDPPYSAALIKAKWVSSEKSEVARVVGWEEEDGEPIALITSHITPKFEKKEGERIKVKIEKVFRDPEGEGGWILAKTEDGIEIPIELNEMSLDPLGHGLELIEGNVLELSIKGFDEEGIPRLSNIDNVIRDLQEIRNQILIPEVLQATKVQGEALDKLHEVVKRISDLIEERSKILDKLVRING
jgi:HrpA-like RNA helicase